MPSYEIGISPDSQRLSRLRLAAAPASASACTNTRPSWKAESLWCSRDIASSHPIRASMSGRAEFSGVASKAIRCTRPGRQGADSISSLSSRPLYRSIGTTVVKVVEVGVEPGPRARVRRSAQGRTDVQTGLGVDDDLLRGDHPVDLDLDVEGDAALDHRERDRPELVVARGRADVPHGLAVAHQVTAARGQPVLGAVEVQQGEPARQRPGEQ